MSNRIRSTNSLRAKFKELKINISLTVFSLLFFSCTIERQDSLVTLTLEDKELKISSIRERPDDECSYNCITIHFRLTNSSKNDIILYGFNGSFELAEIDEDNYCNSYRFEGKSIFIFNNGQQIIPHNRLDGFGIDLATNQARFKKEIISDQIIKQNESLLFTETINLKDFDLNEPNIYKLRINYYQCDDDYGKLKEQRDENEKNLGLKSFKGRLISNNILLTVE